MNPSCTTRPGPCDGSLYAPRGPLPAGMRRKTNRPKPGPLEPPKGRYLGYGVNIYCMRPDRHSFSKGGSFSAWGESICPGNFFGDICSAQELFFCSKWTKEQKKCFGHIYILTSSVAVSFSKASRQDSALTQHARRIVIKSSAAWTNSSQWLQAWLLWLQSSKRFWILCCSNVSSGFSRVGLGGWFPSRSSRGLYR